MRLHPRVRLLAGILLFLALAPVQAAYAHAQLLSTNPSANAVLGAAPANIELVFNEPVSPLAIKLIRPDGSSVELTDSTTGGTTTSISLPAAMTDGTHVLSWRVVSTDGHPIGGSLVFSIGAVTGAAEVQTAADPVVSASLWTAKVALFIALFVGVGGAAFTAVAPSPTPARRLAHALSLAGIIIAPMTLGLQGLDALGLAMSSILDAKVWSTGLSTSYGATALAATAAFLLATAALVLVGRLSASLGVLAAATAALSLAMSGHASAAEPQLLTRPAVFLHIAGVLFWVGALVPLWHLLRDGTDAATRALASFSKGIPFAVAPLVLSGVTLAVIQLGAPGTQWLTGYGFILAAKLALLTALFGLALWNRLLLTTPTLAGDAAARTHLRRSIALELVIVVVILGLVAGWRFTPPPRALATAQAAEVPADPIMEHLIDGSTMAMVTIDPGIAGTVCLDAMISDIEHNPKQAQAVSVIISNPVLGIEPIKQEATEADGIWTVEDLSIPIAGIWQLEVEVRVSRFELVRLRGELIIP